MPNTVDDEFIRYPVGLKAVLKDKNAILKLETLTSFVVVNNKEFYEDLLKGKFECKIEKDERMKIIKYLYENGALIKMNGYLNYVKELLDTKEYNNCICYDNLTINDLEELIKKNSVVLTQDNFIIHYICELGNDINRKADDYKEKVKVYFEKLLKFSSLLPSEQKGMSFGILYSILYSNIILSNEFDDKLFKEWIKAGKTYTLHYPFNVDKVRVYNNDFETEIFNCIMGNVKLGYETDKCEITKLIYKYFYHYYELNQSIDKLDSFLKTEWFNEQKYTLNVYFDKDVSNSLKHLNEMGCLDTVESIKLEVDELNKTYFHENETVEITCYLKNIPELDIKIFEINTLEFGKVYIIIIIINRVRNR